MIYTLTLNPSLDYILELDEIKPGKLNRTNKEAVLPGGKGINVSQVLKNFGVDNKALGFLGGFTGDYIEKVLHSSGIETDFVRIKEQTRINIKLKAGQETEINARGPEITEENFEMLKGRIYGLSKNDTLILSGSVPHSMPETTYEELVKICHEKGINFIADTEGIYLEKILPYRPFLIKPNHHELGDLFDTVITGCDEAVHYGKKLVDRGAQNVIVSLADKGAVFINKEIVFISNVPKGEVISSVGAGDSMVAAFTAVYKKTESCEEAFRFCVAAGSATAFSSGLCTLEDAEKLVPQVHLIRSPYKGED